MSDSIDDYRRIDYVNKNKDTCLACKNSCWKKVQIYNSRELFCNVYNTSVDTDGICDDYEEM